MVRMHASGGKQAARMLAGEGRGLARPLTACARDDHLDDADGRRAGQDGVPVAVITVVGEVDPDVDQCG
jgi:hypothetical protein